MTDHPNNQSRGAQLCRDNAERARRLADGLGWADREMLLRFAEEQERRAAELERAMHQGPAGQVTFEQEQVQQQQADKESDRD